MNDYIERKTLNDYLSVQFTMSMGFLSTDVCKGANQAREIFQKILSEIPAADVVPVRHGRWLEHKSWAKCSECGYLLGFETTYCPNCGADMREVEHD